MSDSDHSWMMEAARQATITDSIKTVHQRINEIERRQKLTMMHQAAIMVALTVVLSGDETTEDHVNDALEILQESIQNIRKEAENDS